MSEALLGSWYAVLNAELNNMQPYLDMFKLMENPRLEPLDFNGQKFGKLTYSAFEGCTDYEEVLRETRMLISILTGAMRIKWEPGHLFVVNIVRVFEDGREEKLPPHGRPVRIELGMGYVVRK